MEVNAKTKFNVGDTVLRFNRNTMKLEEFKISHISLSIYENGTNIFYYTEQYELIGNEDRLFASKEEFINKL